VKQIILDFRVACGSLARDLGFTGPAVFSLSLGVGLLISIVGLLRLDSLDPLVLGSTVTPEYVRDAGWGGTWDGTIWSPAQIQAEHFERLLLVLAVVAAAGFAITCFTVVILALVRASTRTPEMALRTAVGATRRRLVSSLFAEGAILAFLGTLAGLVLGFVGLSVARNSWPHEVLVSGFHIDPWMLALGLGAPLLIAVPFSLFAAAGVLRRSDLSGALTAVADAAARRGALILQDFLAVVQLAVSLALVVGAGLLIRNTLPGGGPAHAGSPDPRGIMTAQLDLPEAEYTDEWKRVTFYERLFDGLGKLPNAKAETLSTPGASLGVGSVTRVTAQCGRCYRGQAYVPLMPGYVQLHAVSPGFFENLGVHLLDGREFTRADRPGAPEVMIVNSTFAASHFEAGQPIGRKVQIGGVRDPWYTVVGVVDDVGGRAIGVPARAVPVAYVPIFQDPPLSADLTVQAGGEPEDLAAAAEQVIPGTKAIVSGASTMAARLAHQLAPTRWLGLLLGVVGGLTLIVAMHGAYSVMRYKVSRRRKEIGICRALGAKRGSIVRMIVLQSLALTCIGAALGLWGTLLLAGWLDIIVPGLRPFDIWIYGGSLLLLSAAALVGGSLPARQAARVHPAVAIRAE
jgi:predicted permease